MIEYLNVNEGTSSYTLDQIQSFSIVKSLINEELTGIFNTETLRDMNNIIHMYQVYNEGASFTVDKSSGDWLPSQWRSKQIKALIDKEARFLFSTPPDLTIKDKEATTSDNTRVSPNQNVLNSVLKQNKFNSKLIRAAKDCLIGKRLAIAVNFNEESGITVSFIPSLEFIYETDPNNVDVITKFIQFYSIVVNDSKDQQRVYKKKWYMQDGKCRVVEELYDGNANLIETITPDQETLFSYIPVSVVINSGLTGDPFGSSDVESLEDTESYFSKLVNKDMDSLRKGTDQITYAIDADPRTTKGLSRAPGAFWDLATDPAKDGSSVQVGTLDNPMSYSSALDSTLSRLRSDMYDQLDIPDTTGDALQGVITSGKTMQAIYWGLTVRCNEKMLDWAPAFEAMTESIFEGCRLYPNIARMYTDESIVDGYEILVDNSYPILQDETEEKSSDMLEVSAGIRSRKSYMKKWLGLTDTDAEAELRQIQLEKSMLEQDNYAVEAPAEAPVEEEIVEEV